MQYSSNLESQLLQDYSEHDAFWIDDPMAHISRCVSCDGEVDAASKGEIFCSDCIDWSRQAGLDELYDDLGMAG